MNLYTMVDTPETTNAAASSKTNTQLTGRVKWFNNKAGYGFITVSDEGDYSGKDVFVHHSVIHTSTEQYKYLVQGEYVDFSLQLCENDDHEYQASGVRGIKNGKLMCETRNENRTRDSENVDGNSVTRTRQTRRPSNQGQGQSTSAVPRKFSRVAVHVRGTGPREGEEWMLVRKNRRGPTRGPTTNRSRSDETEDQE